MNITHQDDYLPGPVHQQWVATLDAIRDPIFVTDGSDRIVRANKAFSDLAAASYREILNRLVATALPWISLKNSDRYLNVQVAPDGRLFELRCFPMGNSSGDHIVIMDDVTSQKALELLKLDHLHDKAHALIETIQTISATLEIMDPYTATHSENVAMLAKQIAIDLGYDEAHANGIYIGACAHDLGKLYIPSGILNRPGKLTQAELNLIKMHPEVGFGIMKNLEFPWPVHDIILQHHERINGSGYPAGLKGDKISMAARIIAVADVVDAMSSHRPYRPALGREAALEEIESNSGVLYDSEVVNSCLRVFKNSDGGITQNWKVAFPRIFH